MKAWPSLSKGELPLLGRRILLRPPEKQDYENWAELREKSRDLLRPWEPSWSEDELTKKAFRRRLQHYQTMTRLRKLLPLFALSRNSGGLIGAFTLSNFRAGVSQSCNLGYWIGVGFHRQGYATEAIQLVMELSFNFFMLHRVEAACQPHNHASQNLLKKCGFKCEGYARQYLKIDGVWRDHLLFALLGNEFIRGHKRACNN